MTLGAEFPGSGQLRLMAVASRLYHVHGLRQKQIGERLNVSQARVSRLLRHAEAEGLVRTVLAVPEGLFPELEEVVERRYGLSEVHVLAVDEDRESLPRALGRSAARYLSAVALQGEVVGFTSWSTTLQEMAFALEPTPRPVARHVVEMLGDLGSPLSQHAAARATQAMASALGAAPVFLRTPGVLTTAELRDASLADPYVCRALGLLDSVDVAFVGVGPPAVHSMLSAGDSFFTPEQLAEVRMSGAAGQLNQRFIDAQGQPLVTPLDDLVVGSTLDQLRAAGRRIVVAGGAEKRPAIAAALRGGWMDVLITDAATARELVDEEATSVGELSRGDRLR
jgi:DNA-binding transcriptional regulator LsrR (DeoR family)